MTGTATGTPLLCRWCLGHLDSGADHAARRDDTGRVVCLWPCGHAVVDDSPRCLTCQPTEP